MIVLRYPPPLACPGCAQAAALFASRAGWRCWRCLVPDERAGARSPVTARDARDLAEIRRRLGLRASKARHGPRAGARPDPPAIPAPSLRHVAWAAIRSRAGG